MKQKTNNAIINLSNPLMIAYLIFIFITMGAYAISSTFKCFEFSEWNRIVVAVTVSSYFFTSSNFQKNRNGIYQETNLLFVDYLNQVEAIKNNRCYSNESNADTRYHSDKILNAKIDELNESIDIMNRKIKRSRNIYYVWCTLGFLTFLIILLFNGVSDFLANSQSMLTVMAFFLMLVYEEAFTIAKKKINEDNLERISPLEEVLQLMNEHGFVLIIQQEEQNGQAEDGE